MKAPSISLARLGLASSIFCQPEPGTPGTIWRKLENASDGPWHLALPSAATVPVGSLEVVDADSGQTVGHLSRPGDAIRLAPRTTYLLYFIRQEGSVTLPLRLADDHGTFLEFSALVENDRCAIIAQASRMPRSLTGPFIQVHGGDLLITRDRLRVFWGRLES